MNANTSLRATFVRRTSAYFRTHERRRLHISIPRRSFYFIRWIFEHCSSRVHTFSNQVSQKKKKKKWNKSENKTRIFVTPSSQLEEPFLTFCFSFTLYISLPLLRCLSLVADILYPYVKTIWYEIHSAQLRLAVLIPKVISELLKSPQTIVSFPGFRVHRCRAPPPPIALKRGRVCYIKLYPVLRSQQPDPSNF